MGDQITYSDIADQNANAKDEVTKLAEISFNLLNEVEALTAKLDAVRPYIQHKLGCGTSIVECIEWGVEPKCTCGLAALQGEDK